MLKLEVGKYYRNNEGHIITIVRFDMADEKLPFLGDKGYWYTREGRIIPPCDHETCNNNRQYDLIEEVIFLTPAELSALKAENERLRECFAKRIAEQDYHKNGLETLIPYTGKGYAKSQWQNYLIAVDEAVQQGGE